MMTTLNLLQALSKPLPPEALVKELAAAPLLRKTAHDFEKEFCSQKAPLWQKNGSPPDVSESIPKLPASETGDTLLWWVRSLESAHFADLVAQLPAAVRSDITAAEAASLPLSREERTAEALANILRGNWCRDSFAGISINPHETISQIHSFFAMLVARAGGR
jgi:hypothetical protein